jgi:hypothetical protein
MLCVRVRVCFCLSFLLLQILNHLSDLYETLHLLGLPQRLTFGFTVASNKDSVRDNLWAVHSAGGNLK